MSVAIFVEYCGGVVGSSCDYFEVKVRSLSDFLEVQAKETST